VPQLLLALARAAAGTFRLDDREHLAGGVEEAVVRDAVPGLGVVAVHRHFEADLRSVV